MNIGGGKHTFKIMVTIRGHGANWDGDPLELTVEAFSLKGALEEALARPHQDWWAKQIAEEREEDHDEALGTNRYIETMHATTERMKTILENQAVMDKWSEHD